MAHSAGQMERHQGRAGGVGVAGQGRAFAATAANSVSDLFAVGFGRVRRLVELAPAAVGPLGLEQIGGGGGEVLGERHRRVSSPRGEKPGPRSPLVWFARSHSRARARHGAGVVTWVGPSTGSDRGPRTLIAGSGWRRLAGPASPALSP